MSESIVAQTVFEGIRKSDGSGEYWSARELMQALGYAKWQKFADALERAVVACGNSGQDAENHFTRSGKMVEIGSRSKRTVEDYRLTRYACYLTAMNGDPRKPEIAAAQTYFAIKTRQAEVAQPAVPQTYAQALMAAAKAELEKEQLTLKVQELTPKAELHDTFIDSSALLSMHNAAQLLNIGRQALFARLRAEGVLMDGSKAGEHLHNTPYRRYAEAGYFEVKTRTVKLPNGRDIQQFTTYVTPSGMAFLRRLLGVKPSNRPLPLIGATA